MSFDTKLVEKVEFYKNKRNVDALIAEVTHIEKEYLEQAPGALAAAKRAQQRGARSHIKLVDSLFDLAKEHSALMIPLLHWVGRQSELPKEKVNKIMQLCNSGLQFKRTSLEDASAAPMVEYAKSVHGLVAF